MAPRVIQVGSNDGRDFLLVVPQRYNPQGRLGQGSYGVVCECFDEEKKVEVAMKSVSALHSYGDNQLHFKTAKNILRELLVLRHFQGRCPLIVQLHEAIRCEYKDHARILNLHIITERMDSDLEHIINDGQITEANAASFTYQLLLGLSYLHRCGIIHRDLKPRNLLVNDLHYLKIADFGQARGTLKGDDAKGTAMVGTLSYQAPEIISFSGTCPESVNYNEKVDSFSAGCILGEMLRSIVLRGTDLASSPCAFVLFPPNPKSGRHHLRDIMRVVGCPDDEDLLKIQPEGRRNSIRNDISKVEPRPLESLLPGIDTNAISLLKQLLQFLHSKRCTASSALRHSWLAPYAEEFKGLTKCDLPRFNDSYENIEDLKTILDLVDAALDEVIGPDPASPLKYSDLQIDPKPLATTWQSQVWRAVGPSGRVYALKVMSKCKISDLEREARAQRFHHQNIVAVHGLFKAEKAILMEYMDAGSLIDVTYSLSSIRRIPLPVLRSVSCQVMAGLAYLHESKEGRHLHRDIKTHNILVNYQGMVKIADFGSMADISTVSWRSTYQGTKTYMSPERLNVDGYNRSADIWSAAVVFAECALGRFPLNEVQVSELMQSVPPCIEELKALEPKDFPSAPESRSTLWQVVEDCLQSDPTRRPTAKELVTCPFMSVEEPTELLKEWLKKQRENTKEELAENQ